ncbi:hypothetical protein ACWKSP_16840 [Micromonosporaceae bacterium Da 78-11]
MTNRASELAAGWAAAYGTLALTWSVTGRGFPFGPDDPGRGASPLRDLDPAVGAPVFAGVLLCTAIVLLLMRGREQSRGLLRAAVLSWVWLVAAVLLVVVADVRLLTIAGYLPILIVGFPFGWPPVDYADVFTWTLANEAIAVTGGLLLATAALRWQRRTGGACESCGRTDEATGWTTPAAAARWGRVAVWVAAVIPALYAIVRLSWAAGIPLGISADFLHEMQRTGLVWAGAGLGAFALVGTILTTGLTMRWGERFPRWMIGLAGRRVPIRLATVPAGLVAIFVSSASVSLLSGNVFGVVASGEGDLALLPMLLWPLWGPALGAAAFAYHLRRRSACVRCGRGDPARGVVPEAIPGAY